MTTGNHIADYPDMREDDKDEFKTCLDCWGDGKAVVDYTDDGKAINGTCPRCKGTGEILIEN